MSIQAMVYGGTRDKNQRSQNLSPSSWCENDVHVHIVLGGQDLTGEKSKVKSKTINRRFKEIFWELPAMMAFFIDTSFRIMRMDWAPFKTHD